MGFKCNADPVVFQQILSMISYIASSKRRCKLVNLSSRTTQSDYVSAVCYTEVPPAHVKKFAGKDSSILVPFGRGTWVETLDLQWEKSRRKVRGYYLQSNTSIDRLSRHLWPGKELHHSNPSSEKTTNQPPRLQKTMYLQGYLPSRAAEQEESLQVFHPINYLLLYEGHPVPPP